MILAIDAVAINNNPRKPTRYATFGDISWFAQHGHILTGESPEATLIVGRLQPKARVSVATRNLKEAGGKHLV